MEYFYRKNSSNIAVEATENGRPVVTVISVSKTLLVMSSAYTDNWIYTLSKFYVIVGFSRGRCTTEGLLGYT